MADFIDQPRDPDLTALLELFREVVKDSIHVMLPGRIVSYDAGSQQAVVQALVKTRYIAEDGSTIVSEELPSIHNVPVEFCGPARGRITWPVDAGDTCEIRFSSSSLARWIRVGGSSVDPGEDRRHDLTDAVCFVGLHSPASPPTDAPQDAVVVHVSDGTTIKLGSSSANQSAVLGDSFFGALSTLLTAINVFAGTCTTTPSGTPATALATAISNFTGAIASMKSSTTKLE